MYGKIKHCTECTDCKFGVDISVYVCNHGGSSLSRSFLPTLLKFVPTIPRLRPCTDPDCPFVHFLRKKKKHNSSPPVFLLSFFFFFVHIFLLGGNLKPGCLGCLDCLCVQSLIECFILLRVQVQTEALCVNMC